jgi:hypothetical protein
MTELDEAIERFARPRRGIDAFPEESDEVAGQWALQTLLAETVIQLRRRGIEPVETVMVAPGAGASGSRVYKPVAPCWPMEIFALTSRGVALPYSMLTTPIPGLEERPRIDAPIVCVRPTPIDVGPGSGDVEVNRRGQLLWRWAVGGAATDQPWTTGFRARFEANWSEGRPGALADPIAFAIVDHLDSRIERGVLH